MIKKYFLAISIVFVISLIYSRFMVSVCMIGYIALAIAKLRKDPSIQIKSFFVEKAYVGLVLVFLAVVFSGINSEDMSQWLHQVKLKLPFLFLPFAFWALNPIDNKMRRIIHAVLIGTIIISSFQVLVEFLSDFKAISLSIGKGKSIPTPIDHIHYSIMVAYAISVSFLNVILTKQKKTKILYFLGGIYLFGFAHFLSVRTGIVLSYAGIGLALTWYVITRRKYAIGFLVAGLLVLLPFVAFHTIEPFKRKINYMYWDYAKYKEGKGKSYSDSERLMSYEIAIDLIKEKPMVGHGIGDLRPIMIRMHKQKFGDKEKYIYPHNQYLYILTTMGILGALLFFFGLLSPIVFTKKHNVFLSTLFILMLLSFLVENTIQRAVITGFFLFFILLNLNRAFESKQVV